MSNSASNSYTIRLHLPQQGNAFADALATINQMDGRVGAIDIVKTEGKIITRDITIETQGDEHAQKIYDSLATIPDITIGHMSDRTFMMHIGGKIEIRNRQPINHRDD